MSWRINKDISQDLERWRVWGKGTPSNEKKVHLKVCRQESRTWEKACISTWWSEQSSGFTEEKKEDKSGKGTGIPQAEVMDSHWHFLKRAVTWSDLGWRKSNLIVEKRLATRKFRAKSIPFLATLQNLSICTKGVYFIRFSFISIPFHVFYFLIFLYRSQILFRVTQHKSKIKKENSER